MEPKGVRLACPECRLDVVMEHEGQCPAPVTKVVEGVPYCPNCNVPMTPVASVDTTPRPSSGITAAMTVEDAANKVAEIGREVEALADDLKEAAEVHRDAKKAYDAKVITLRVAVERLGRVCQGEQVQADLPLLGLAEQPETVTATLDQDTASAIEQAARTAGQDLQARLVKVGVMVTLEDIEAWTADEYTDVADWLELAVDLPDAQRPALPACLLRPREAVHEESLADA